MPRKMLVNKSILAVALPFPDTLTTKSLSTVPF